MSVNIDQEMNESIMILQREIQSLRREVKSLKNIMIQSEGRYPSTEVVYQGTVFPTSDGLDGKISDILLDLGVPAHLKGYIFLRDAIRLAYKDFSLLSGGVTKILYPAIANKHRTTANKVERAIRHAIEASWYYSVESHNIISERYNRKPTNSSFIALLADKLRLETE